MDKKNIRNKKIFKIMEAILRDIIGGLQIIPFAPKDEYDRFVHMIISMLYEGSSKLQLQEFIQNEILVPNGLRVSEDKLIAIANQIMNAYGRVTSNWRR